VSYSCSLLSREAWCRRVLPVFQNAGVREIPIQRVSLRDPKIFDEFIRKYKPINQGANIIIMPYASMLPETKELLRQHGKIK